MPGILGYARYVQTTAFNGGGAVGWAAATNQAWFNTTKKTSTLVTHATTGSGITLASNFTVNAPGVWNIGAGVKSALASGGARVTIAVGTAAESAGVAAQGAPAVTGYNVANANVTLELNNLSVIYIMWKFPSISTLSTVDGDCNYVSFAFLGAV